MNFIFLENETKNNLYQSFLAITKEGPGPNDLTDAFRVSTYALRVTQNSFSANKHLLKPLNLVILFVTLSI